MRKLYRETSIALWEEWIITSLQSYTSSIVIEFASQAASLRQLEEENQEAAARLEEVVYRGDMLLEKIQSALADIAQSQLCTRSGAPSQSTPPESWQRLTPSKHGLYRLYTAGILYWRSCVKCAVWFWFHSVSAHCFPSHVLFIRPLTSFSTLITVNVQHPSVCFRQSPSG